MDALLLKELKSTSIHHRINIAKELFDLGICNNQGLLIIDVKDEIIEEYYDTYSMYAPNLSEKDAMILYICNDWNKRLGQMRINTYSFLFKLQRTYLIEKDKYLELSRMIASNLELHKI